MITRPSAPADESAGRHERVVASGMLEAFSEPCETCNVRGVIAQTDPVEAKPSKPAGRDGGRSGGKNGGRDGSKDGGRRRRGKSDGGNSEASVVSGGDAYAPRIENPAPQQETAANASD